jgi:hypothetical protein
LFAQEKVLDELRFGAWSSSFKFRCRLRPLHRARARSPSPAVAGADEDKEIAVPEKSEEKLTGQEWQARYNAAAEVARRQYCDIFKFWRGCRYKPCRRAKTCRGDSSHCLQRGRWSLPPDVLCQAELQVRAAVPAHLTGPERAGRMMSATSWLADGAQPK